MNEEEKRNIESILLIPCVPSVILCGMTSNRYILIKTYIIGKVPRDLPLGEEYIIHDTISSVRWWIKICSDSKGNRTPVHHRIGAPARIGDDGSEWWLVNGDLHRLDGPARIDDANIFISRKYEWWIKGVMITSFQRFQKITGLSDAEIIMFKLKYGEMY